MLSGNIVSHVIIDFIVLGSLTAQVNARNNEVGIFLKLHWSIF